MKVVIGVAILIVVILGVFKIWEYWDNVNREKLRAEAEEVETFDSRQLPGLPMQLERSLDEVMAKGPDSFKQWIDLNRPRIKDPRLAAIELDYVLRISQKDPIEAKKVFASVKERTPDTSPLYKRIKSLEKTYE